MRKLFLAALFAVWAGGATADPIGPNCGSCFGNIYTLEYFAITPTNYRIELTVDTSNTTLAPTDFLAQIGFKPVSSSSDIISASLIAAPGGIGAWTQPTLGGLNNSGCTIGPEGFICTSDANSALMNGSTYEWDFIVQVAAANAWLLGTGDASIKGNFGPANGLLLSEPITLQPGTPPPPPGVPEPATLLLLATAALGMWGLRKR